VFNVTANNVNIRGFTVTGSTSFDASGILLFGIKGCTVSNNNVSNNMYGIYLLDSDCNMLTSNNALNNSENGICLDDSSYNLLNSNNVSDNREYGIRLVRYSDKNTLIRNMASNNLFGIEMHYSSHNTLNYNNASNNSECGISLFDANENTLTSNSASNNGYGIWLDGVSEPDGSIDNTLTNNIMTNNKYNFGAGAINYIDLSNIVNGKTIYYLINRSDITLDSASNAGIVYCISCQNISIKNLKLENNEYGVYLLNTTGSNIDKNEASNNMYGILVYDSNNNMLTSNNALSNKEYGIRLLGSSGNTLTNNNAFNNSEYGIQLWESNSNTLTNNNAFNNSGYGITLGNFCDNNILSDNTMTGNKYNFGAMEITGTNVINNIDTSNTVEGKSIYYLVNLSDIVLDSTLNVGTVYCIDCQNISIKDLRLEKNECDIYFNNVTESNIDNNEALNSKYGIYLYDSSDNKLNKNNALNNSYGFNLFNSSNNGLKNNNASKNNEYGISLDDSSCNNTLTNNTMTDNKYNFGAGEINNIDTSNTVDGNRIYYLVNLSDIILDSASNAGTVYCISCQNISIKNLKLENNEYGISLYNTTKSIIDNIEASNNMQGICLRDSSNNTLNNNNASNSSYGIRLWGSNSNTLTDNNVSVYLFDSGNNVIYTNYFNNIDIGDYNANNNTWNSTTRIAYRYNGKNYESYIGNFYSDYTGVDVDDNGIGDIPYNHYESGVDNYPLIVSPKNIQFLHTESSYHAKSSFFPSFVKSLSMAPC
jgi:parallel beta-helix repeat protein